jgi:hypothetical protein
MELKPISGPAEEPVTLADAKLTLRVDHAEDDSRIQRMIGAAREEAEQITSRRFGPQTWELVLDAFESTITLPAPPVQQAEHRTGRRYGVQTWLRAYDAFPSWSSMLPDPPVSEIVSIKYDDIAGTEQTLDPADYRLRPHSEPAVVLPIKSWPATLAEPGAVRITYRCGLDATDARWASLSAWMLLAIGTWYHNREAGGAVQTHELPRDFWNGLLDPLVFYGVTTT